MTAALSAGAAWGALAGLVLGPFVASWVRTAPAYGPWWWPAPVGAHARLTDVGSDLVELTGRLRIVVTIAAVAFGALGGAVGLGAAWPGLVLAGVVAAPLAVIDVRIHRLPDRLVAPLAIAELLTLGVAAAITTGGVALLRAVIAGAAVAIVLGGLALLLPRAFGMGDAKLAAVLSMPVGWVSGQAVVLGFVVAIVLGALVAEVLILTRRARWKTAVAFGPALIVGYLAAAAVLGG